MSVSKSNPSICERLWLIQTSPEDERTAQIHPYRKGAADWISDGPIWQVTWNAAGLQRLRAKWQQGGKPVLALDIRGNLGALDPVELDDLACPNRPATGSAKAAFMRRSSASTQWVLCAPGYAFHGRIMTDSARSALHWQLLKKGRLPVWAACRVMIPSSPPDRREDTSSQAASPAAQGQHTDSLLNAAGSPPGQTFLTCWLVRAYLIGPGQSITELQYPKWRQLTPSPIAWAIALCMLSITLLHDIGMLKQSVSVLQVHYSIFANTQHPQRSDGTPAVNQPPDDSAHLLRAACKTLREQDHESH